MTAVATSKRAKPVKTAAPSPESLDTDNRIDRKYFLNYQVDQIMDEARLVVTEKSIRVGITFAHAMRAVRRRMKGLGNLIHCTVTSRVAKSFALDCRKFCRVYDVVGASDINETEVFNPTENRRETAYEIEFKNQGNKIMVFGSNPDAPRGEGGEVNVDEICSHKQPDDMMAAAGGRAMWGHPVSIWSSHKGLHSALNRLIKAERAKGSKSRWKIKTITLYEALDQGLLEKINAVSGQSMTRDQFIEDTRAMVGGDEAFDEECLCKPRASGNQAIKWGYIDSAKRSYPLLRKHIEGDGAFDADGWISGLVPILRGAAKVALGYDVARTGHLSSIPIFGKYDATWKHMALLTMHGRKFTLQRDAIAAFMRAIPSSVAAGDSTGLGMQTCEDLTTLFGDTRFVGCNFGALKNAIGTKLVKMFEDGRINISDSPDHEDIPFDLAAIQTQTLPSGRNTFIETSNPINKLSHCDIAWSIALAIFVGEDDSGIPGIVTV